MPNPYEEYTVSGHGEAAPAHEYDPHPSYSQDGQYSQDWQYSQDGQYSHYYDGYGHQDQGLEHHFAQLDVDDQPPDGYDASYREGDLIPTEQDYTHSPYSYAAGHAADSASYPPEDPSYEQSTSAQPEMGGDPRQGFEAVVGQAQASAYTGGTYPSYEQEGVPGPSSGAYAPPDAPLDPVPESGVFPAQSRDGSREEIDMSQFRVEWSSEFSPGTIFKVMWPEPLGETSRTTQMVQVNPQFYAGIRRFIVVTSGDGNSSCVPILTYERRACSKSGVNPKTHGIVHGAGHKPKALGHEPKLGYKPIAVDLTSGERLAPESRVNYAKLQTIEHNVKVRIIGRVIDEHLGVVRYAVDDCWEKRQRAFKKHKSKK